MHLSLIIPVYNEEKRIARVLDAYYGEFLISATEFELITVCNGCTDRSESIITEYAKGKPEIKLLCHKNRLGKGGAVLKGFIAAKNQLVGFVDSDSSVSPKTMLGLFLKLYEYDCVIGSRREKGSMIRRKQPIPRRISSIGFNMIINMLFSLGISDTQCGAKVFRRRSLDKIIPSMKTMGYEFDVELLWRISRAGFSICEAPIRWKHSEGSKFSLSNAPTMLYRIIKLRISG